MSSVFLFGAGASYGSGPCHPHPPPLGDRLFSALQAEGGVAASISDDLAAVFRCNFETGMDRFWNERNTDVTPLLSEMAEYLSRFEPRDGNAYVELLRILGGTRKKATFVTTNYDLLIELAATLRDLHVSYTVKSVPANNIPILKIHGSCNFLPDIGEGRMHGFSIDMSAARRNLDIVDGTVRIAKGANEIREFCRTNNALAPAVAMYSPDKRVLYCSKFVLDQRRYWEIALRNATRVYVIGLRVHLVDHHIWDPLAAFSEHIYYVGREPEDFRAWAESAGRKKARVLARSFQDVLPMIAKHLGR